MTKYIVNKGFSSSVERTPRVLEIAESFGLGLSEKRFVIYDHLNVEVKQGDVVYITGQSGSGKSLLLRELRDQMRLESRVVRDLDDIAFPDKPVVDCLGTTTSDALDLLAKAGISDAWIYIRKPKELSDGQRYRLKLAMLMADPHSEVWVADEFGAVLDRITAKCVAFNMQKVARAMGKTLIVATTHTDLADELAPSLKITKRFREKVEIQTK